MSQSRPRPLLVVRFAPGEALVEGQINDLLRQKWAGTRVAPRLARLPFRPLLRSLGSDRIQEFGAKARERGQNLDRLFRYFSVSLDPDTNVSDLKSELKDLQMLQSSALPLDFVRVQTEAPPLPVISTPRRATIEHLQPAPEGIGLEAVINAPGGRGQGQVVADVESGWWTGHSDFQANGGLSALSFNPVPGAMPADDALAYAHGTQVIGVLAARGSFTLGVASDLGTVHMSSVARAESDVAGEAAIHPVANAILAAIDVLNEGDILLIEQQAFVSSAALVNPGSGPPPSACGPVEVDPDVFDAILLATSLGRIVVEASGNGVVAGVADHVDLDRLPAWGDSGAIIVGASDYASGVHVPVRGTCRGGRIDCFARGAGVFTSSPLGGRSNLNSSSTTNFGGSSAAAAIVAGVAAILQSMRRAAGLAPLTPLQMRTLLRDPMMNTGSAAPASDKIGVMPNLANLALNVLLP